MKIVFIGAGNVATHLATELYKQSFDIIQIYSRSNESAQTLANKVHAAYTTDINSVTSDADIYIYSVKDSVLHDLASKLPKNNGVWIHTAGSIPLEIFKEYTSQYGVLYPFQTFSKDRELDWKDIPIFIEASDPKSLEQLKHIASTLSSNIKELSSEKRKYVHLTGVFACNFTNYMYTLSEEILKKAELDFNIVLPLIDETCLKVHELSPYDAQTGPAIRFDDNVMKEHIDLLDNEETKDIYRLISKGIYETHKNK